MNETLLELLQDAADSAFTGSPVRFAYLFGSAARRLRQLDGAGKGVRDVDVAVHCGGDDYDLLDLLGRVGELERVLPTAGDVDLLVLDDAPLRLVARVLRDRVVIYDADEAVRVRYEDERGRVALDHELVAARTDADLLMARSQQRR